MLVELQLYLSNQYFFIPAMSFFFKIPPSFFQAGNCKQKCLSILRVFWLNEGLITLLRLESLKIV